MTNEEAIKYLKQLYPNGGYTWLDEQRIEAISMAISALETPTLPSDLNEAAERYAHTKKNSEEKEIETELPLWGYYIANESFKAGAEWMAGQYYKTLTEKRNYFEEAAEESYPLASTDEMPIEASAYYNRAQVIRQEAFIKGAMFSNYCGDGDFVGPPLTPEILEKSGFRLRKGCTSAWDWDKGEYSVHISGLPTCPVGQTVTIYIPGGTAGAAFSSHKVLDELKIRGVYQLQCALRLCGIEKEIIL